MAGGRAWRGEVAIVEIMPQAGYSGGLFDMLAAKQMPGLSGAVLEGERFGTASDDVHVAA